MELDKILDEKHFFCTISSCYKSNMNYIITTADDLEIDKKYILNCLKNKSLIFCISPISYPIHLLFVLMIFLLTKPVIG